MGDVKIIIDEIEDYSGNNLKRKDDLLSLLELGYSNHQEKIIDELSFTAKYVQGLFRVLDKAAGNTEIQNTGQIKADLSGNLEKVKDSIEQLLLNADEKTKKYFRDTYLQFSQSCLFNLTELMNDLEWTKKYFNYIKRANPS